MDNKALVFFLCLVLDAQCLDMTSDDFEVIDGIRVRKDSTVKDKPTLNNSKHQHRDSQ